MFTTPNLRTKPTNKNKELLHQSKAKAVITKFVVFAAFSRFIYQKFHDKAQSSGPLKKKILGSFWKFKECFASAFGPW